MQSQEVPLFIEAKQFILDQDTSSIEHIIELMDTLESFECEARRLKRLVCFVSYDKIIEELITPIDELFELEYFTNS